MIDLRLPIRPGTFHESKGHRRVLDRHLPTWVTRAPSTLRTHNRNSPSPSALPQKIPSLPLWLSSRLTLREFTRNRNARISSHLSPHATNIFPKCPIHQRSTQRTNLACGPLVKLTKRTNRCAPIAPSFRPQCRGDPATICLPSQKVSQMSLMGQYQTQSTGKKGRRLYKLCMMVMSDCL